MTTTAPVTRLDILAAVLAGRTVDTRAARLARKDTSAQYARIHRLARANGPRGDRWRRAANRAAIDLAAREAAIRLDGGTFSGWADATREALREAAPARVIDGIAYDRSYVHRATVAILTPRA